MGGITHHANGRRQPFSDSTTREFRGETVALVDTGVVGTRPVPLGLQHAVTAGCIRRRRGPDSCTRTYRMAPQVRGGIRSILRTHPPDTSLIPRATVDVWR